MSWAYVPESSALNSASKPQSPLRALCALSSAMPTAVASCVASIPSALSGPTSEASLPLLGVDWSMSFLQAFPVNHGPALERGGDSRTPAGSGQTFCESSAKFDPVTSSWKTCLPLFPEEDGPLFAGPWPRWGMMVRGELFPVAPWAPATSARECLGSLCSESGAWPTPTVSHMGNRDHPGAPVRPSLRDSAKQRTTPLACNAKGARSEASTYRDLCKEIKDPWLTPTTGNRGKDWGGKGESLTDQCRMWPTPTATPYGSNQSPSPGATVRPSLQELSKTFPGATDTATGEVAPKGEQDAPSDSWPTPKADDGHRAGRKRKSPNLPQVIQPWESAWPTPTARDHKRGKIDNGKSRPLSEVALSGPQGETPPTGQTSPPTCIRLNPLFVEWLMGFPEGHSDPFTPTRYEPWATQLRQFVRRLLGKCSGIFYKETCEK